MSLARSAACLVLTLIVTSPALVAQDAGAGESRRGPASRGTPRVAAQAAAPSPSVVISPEDTPDLIPTTEVDGHRRATWAESYRTSVLTFTPGVSCVASMERDYRDPAWPRRTSGLESGARPGVGGLDDSVVSNRYQLAPGVVEDTGSHDPSRGVSYGSTPAIPKELLTIERQKFIRNDGLGTADVDAVVAASLASVGHWKEAEDSYFAAWIYLVGARDTKDPLAQSTLLGLIQLYDEWGREGDAALMFTEVEKK